MLLVLHFCGMYQKGRVEAVMTGIVFIPLTHAVRNTRSSVCFSSILASADGLTVLGASVSRCMVTCT